MSKDRHTDHMRHMRHTGPSVVLRVRRLPSMVTALVALVALLVVGAPTAAQAASSTEKLTISSASSVRFGSPVTITAGWTKGGKGVTGTLKLQRKSGSSWVKVTNIAVTNGKGTVAVSPTATTQYRWRSTTGASVGKTITVVRSWISFGKPTAVLPVSKSVTLAIAMTLDGKQSGRAVTLQRKSGSKWVTVQKLSLQGPGKGSVTIKPTSTTTYRLARGSLHSAARTVKVDRDWSSISFSSTSLATSDVTTTATIAWYAAGKAATGSVKLQQMVGSTWSTVKAVKVTKGRATVSLKPITTRSYRIVAATSTSAAVKVTVKVNIYPTFTINGAGWGHGVGMSQYGAYGMAQAGSSAAAILAHYYTGSKVAYDAVDPDTTISVQVLGPPSDKKTSVTVGVVDGGWRLRNDQDGGTTVASGTSDGTITFAVSGTSVKATVGGKTYSDTTMRVHWDGTTYYNPSKTTTTTYATVAGAQGQYRHGRLVVTVIDGYLNVVNDLRLEDEYMYGIAEMPSSWGKGGGDAALQAQAIAARAYAEIQIAAGKRSSCGCHLVDDARDQNFTGWKKENEGASATYGKEWVAAVNATLDKTTGQGKVLEDSAGKLLRAYYFSSSGGSTLNSEDVWVSALPYLRSVDDHWSQSASVGNPYASWKVTWTQASAATFFGLKDVVAISVGTYTGGGLKSLTATSSTGATATVSGKSDAMRIKLGVRSPWVSSITGDVPA